MSLELGVRTYKPENSELNTLNESPRTPGCAKPRLQKPCGGQALPTKAGRTDHSELFFFGLDPLNINFDKSKEESRNQGPCEQAD
jgi:hypothetical protein